MNITLDTLKMAILMERRGKAFYRKVAEQTQIPEVKKIFELMAEEEVMHEKFLSEQYSFYEDHNNFEAKELPKESHESVAALILTGDVKNAIAAAGFEAAAISAAIDMENKAIEVYRKRAEESTDSNEKKLFFWLSDWEKSHHKILIDLDNELKEKVWNDNQFWPF
jgi:rubrerythrin